MCRFFIEFARADYRGSFVGSLSPSQTQSLILIALAIPAFFILRYFVNKQKAQEAVLEKATTVVAEEESAPVEE